MTPPTGTDVVALDQSAARRLLDLWNAQQSAYVAHRDLRFDAMADVVRLHCPEDLTILDLACGPGAISDRMLAEFPLATSVAVDYDPILLQVARHAVGRYAGRAEVHDVDLVVDGWEEALTGRQVDAVLTSTALHWLAPEQLLRVYTTVARLLPAGGVLLNADHLRYDESAPALRDIAHRHDAQVQRETFAAGALTYSAWYAEAARHPELAGLTAERDRRFADRPPQAPASLEFHLAALRTAGFAEVGTVWQYLDDYVVFARR
ncbi:class I SAM-dependent methyltransferase [Micromonospora chokoriensis]|uniref:Methyltransferase domain-containing protein n=1 Tax=Micromonospora chokoriensis TaxID=356851 RepID=A0A1C4XGF6_9ACTN|nr:class I SAM-dependent methyltransferase [Micromonospora chokoriensis]SCF07271.1 Methyltransferase domain-containing protein [Micromonospora chokoriensis]